MTYKSFSSVRGKRKNFMCKKVRRRRLQNTKNKKEAQSFSFFASKSFERLRFERREKRITEKSW